MTAIERAEALLAETDLECTGVAYCTPCKRAEKADSTIKEESIATLRGYIGAVKALLAEHTLTVDWEMNGQDHTPITPMLPHYNAFRMGQYTTEDCESCQALGDFERLFPEAPVSTD